MMSFFRWFALAVGAVGFAVFALAFLASIANPGFVEQVARSIIRYGVEKEVQEKIESLDKHFLAGKATALAKGHADDMVHTKRLLAQGLPARLAEVIAEMQNLDSECRKKLRQTFAWALSGALLTPRLRKSG